MLFKLFWRDICKLFAKLKNEEIILCFFESLLALNPGPKANQTKKHSSEKKVHIPLFIYYMIYWSLKLIEG